MITEIFAKIEGNDELVKVSLVMNKDIIEKENTTAMIANGPIMNPSHWKFFSNAFKSINSEPVNGFTFDTELTDGLLAIHKSENGLAEMLADAI